MEVKDSINKVKLQALKNKMLTAALNFNNESYLRLNDSLTNSMDKTMQTIKDSKPVKDAYGNSLLAVGTDDIVKGFSQYGVTNDSLNYPFWTAIYNDSWVFKKAIDKPASDMISAGITVNIQKDADKVLAMYKKYKQPLISLCKWGRLYGGAVAVMMFEGIKDKDYEKPLSKAKIKGKTMRLYVTDRWYGLSTDYSKTVTDMTNIDYGKPEMYTITFANGSQTKFHHSYVIRYENRQAPNIIKNGYLQGWGYAEGAHIINELMRDDQLKADITSLVNKSLLEIVKMSGMTGIFNGSKDEEGQEQLNTRLEMVTWARNINSITFLDKEDDYEQFSFGGISGLSDLMTTNMTLIAAALDMSGILYGDLEGGFSADEVAMERYDNVLHGMCDEFLTDPVTKLLTSIFAILGITEPIDFEFNSIIAKRQTKEKVEAMKDFNDMLITLQDAGILTPQKLGYAIMKYTSKGVIDLGLTDDYIKKELSNEVANEMEDIDLDNLDVDTDKNEKVEIPAKKKDSLFKRIFGGKH